MMRTLLIGTTLFLSACSGPSAPQMPVVDMTGVDAGRHSRDQAACEAERLQTSFYTGDFLAKCMERRGYRVLVSH